MSKRECQLHDIIKKNNYKPNGVGKNRAIKKLPTRPSPITFLTVRPFIVGHSIANEISSQVGWYSLTDFLIAKFDSGLT